MSGIEGDEARDLIVVFCDENGRVLRGVKGPSGFSTLAELIGEYDRAKAEKILAEAATRGVATDWEIFVTRDGRPLKYHFSAVRVDPGILLVGARNRVQMLVELERSLFEAGTDLELGRSRLQEAHLQMATQSEKEAQLIDEYSRLLTELITLQRQLAKRKLAMEDLDAEKTRFLGIAAHDLRNPLQRISLCVDYLNTTARAVLNEKQLKILGVIETTVSSMREILDRFLDVSRIESGRIDLNRELLDLNRLCSERAELSRILAEQKGVVIRLGADRDGSYALVDRNRFNQALDNILMNAIKFAPRGSAIDVEVKTREDEAVISVTDHGPGIEDEKFGELFTLFKSLKQPNGESKSGAGLGLYITRRMIEAHGGRVWVESVPGTSTTFYFSVPVSAEAYEKRKLAS